MPKPTYKALEEKIQQLETEMKILKGKLNAQVSEEFQWQWQATFDAVGTAICLLDSDWNILQCNKATADLFRKPQTEIIGRKCFEMVHETQTPPEDCPVRHLVETKKGQVETLQVNDRWFEISAAPVLDENGELRGIVHIMSDITQLHLSEQKLRSFAELLPQTVFEMDGDGLLTFVNKTGLNIFGFTYEELERGLNGFDMLIPEDREIAKEKIIKVLQGTDEDSGKKYTAQRKDGSTFPILIYASANHDQKDKIGLRGIIVDISEQEQLANERDQLEKQYIQAQKMEAIGRLAGGVAHDLNNMLSPIVGYGELLLEVVPENSPNRKATEQIYNAGLRARDMVQQLLAFSRKQALEIKAVDINYVLSVFEMLLDRILRDDIELELKLSENVPNVLADACQIEQIILNLAVNSQDAMPDGGKITIEVGVVNLGEEDIKIHQVPSPGQYVVLTFSDTGHGMDAETKGKIFDPFYTTKTQGKGTGLGLATVYGIVKQHNGNIRVSSNPGQGTVFKIYFPGTTSRSEKVIKDAVEDEKLFGSESILIAEDNDIVRQMAENILQKYGYKTMCVSGGEECRDVLASNHSFDLVLTDVVLQDTNGKELFSEVKKHCPDSKVVYMSGYTGDVILQHGVLEEGTSFIQKPFSYRDLLFKVREALDHP